jgi:Fe-S-cluster containining protein
LNRADERRQSREDLRLLETGITPERLPRDYVLALARQLERLFRRAQKGHSVDEPLEFLYSFLNASAKRAWPTAGLACKKGCSFCCDRLWVSVTTPEAFHVARTIRGKPGATAIAVAYEARKGVTHEQRATLTTPCALLKDHACSVYHARPANCRHAVSTSVEVCKRAYVEMSGEAIPVPGIFVGMTFVAQTALAAALVRCGLPTRAYELSAAVNRAVVQPELETRWLVGEDVFADLQRDPVDPGAGENVRAVLAEAFS